MEKKAILVSETLKMIIAVGVILLLFVFAAKLLGIFQGKTKLEQARANMDNLEIIIKDIKEGEAKEYILLSPQGWVVTGWPSKGYVKYIPPYSGLSGDIGYFEDVSSYVKPLYNFNWAEELENSNSASFASIRRGFPS